MARFAGCAGLVAALAACGTAAPTLPPQPLTVPIDFVERSWHTEICLAPADMAGRLAALAGKFPGADRLCFGFGERHYMMDGDHSIVEMVASLTPSQAVVLVIPLGSPPSDAFEVSAGKASVVPLRVSRAGADNMSDFIWRSLATGTDGMPVELRQGINPGSMFYAASGFYDALATCNTWSASALRAAGLPIDDAVIFAADVTDQVRRVAAVQARAPQAK